jgi:hypothetical protein
MKQQPPLLQPLPLPLQMHAERLHLALIALHKVNAVGVMTYRLARPAVPHNRMMDYALLQDGRGRVPLARL